MNKVQLTLTDQEVTLLSRYGSQFGYNLPKTIRFVISKASEQILRESTMPTYPMSETTEKKGLQALKEYRSGKTTQVNDVDEFFDSL